MLEKNFLQNLKKEYEQNSLNKVRHRMLNKVGLTDLITDIDTKLNMNFNIEIKMHGITDQKQTGRCWIFAGLNILREKVVDTLKLDCFELSQSYIDYFDKIERFNMLLEKLILYKENKKDLYDLDVSILLEQGIADGGYFTELAYLIKKYGIVPRNNFPETFQSSNTYEINQILSRLLRMFYLELETSNDIHLLKKSYLIKAYTVISNVYGVPPEVFDFEYTDKKGDYHIIRNITPKEFYDQYIKIDLLEEYVEITSYQDEKIKYNFLYERENSARMSGTHNYVVLNVSKREFYSLLLKQMKDKSPVYFYCSTTAKRIDGVWIDIMNRYGEIFDINLKLDKNAILKTNGITNCHCMLLTGVNIIDGKANRWKIENSWGDKYGKQGYCIATNDWVENYVHGIVIHKKYLTEKQIELLKQKPIKINRFDIKF